LVRTTAAAAACFPSGRSPSAIAALHQFADARPFENAEPGDPDVANPFAVVLQQAKRIGQLRAEIETEVDPFGVSGGEDKGAAAFAGEGEMVGDSVDLIDEFGGAGASSRMSLRAARASSWIGAA
jgi:hypothetical protein